jgi:hypothetical protein
MRARKQAVDDLADIRRAPVETGRVFDGVSESEWVQ